MTTSMAKIDLSASPVAKKRRALTKSSNDGKPVLPRTQLLERLELEESMLMVCPRFFTFLVICAMVSISLVGFGVEAQGRINGLLVHSYGLADLKENVVTGRPSNPGIHLRNLEPGTRHPYYVG